MPLILSVYVFLVLLTIHTVLLQLFFMIPLTSPIVMLMRIPFMYLVASRNLSNFTFTILLLFVAKIYRIGILMYGKTNMERVI
jgi:ABC-2 type transport system permease protein